jgi:hypothetical protein
LHEINAGHEKRAFGYEKPRGEKKQEIHARPTQTLTIQQYTLEAQGNQHPQNYNRKFIGTQGNRNHEKYSRKFMLRE